MGEMADFAGEQAGWTEAYAYFPRKRSTKTCGWCGVRGLRWKETPCGWRLFKGDTQHSCNNYPKRKNEHSEIGEVEEGYFFNPFTE